MFLKVSLRKAKKVKTENVLISKKKQDKKRSQKCYHCNKKDYCIKDCRLLKKAKTSNEGSSSTNKENMIEKEIKDLVALVIREMKALQIGMITELYMMTTTKFFN